ncbi:hypothetical protein [Silvibacterium dinghuense]|uniref:Uncharacterized protein n=1 Tax=Silvibacterium dinghuense TaxID=1560006 RepID=A0A4Q1SFY7_9BACT|nr:hypothetical protein [Silvibacterium dinghuense]RXS96456.1 hypothetical protein ESZ00_00380 [Silvibacterium dinghuense]GGG90919.1 hypothetical protein GCM10011586_01810 [Silvibacterium dinghuense]
MLLAASVYTTQNARLRARWKLEGGLPAVPGQKVANAIPVTASAPPAPLTWVKEEYRFLPADQLGPTMDATSDYPGTFVVYDWDTQEIIWQSDWGNLLGNPAGYCFADGILYMNDFEAGNIFRIDADREPGKLLQRISHPYFNDLHSLERTKRGLLAASCGTDLVVEVDLQGNVIWEWWAAEHGYDVTPSGERRESGRGGEHRDRYYHTKYQSTHVNCATIRDPENERYVLAMLFHQGVVVQIDRSLPPSEQKGEVVIDGLARAHSLEKIPGGWILANSLGKELVLLDDNLKRTGVIPYDGGWIQDCTRLPNGNVVLNDVDNTVIVEFAPPAGGSAEWTIVRKVPYVDTWRMGELAVVPAQHEAAFRNAALTATAAH